MSTAPSDTLPVTSPAGRRLLGRLQQAANVLALGILLWWVSPLLSLGGRRPFDGLMPRAALLATMALVGVLVVLWRRAAKARRQARLVQGLQGSGAPNPAAADVLTQRFQQAMALLRSGVAAGGPRTDGDARPSRDAFAPGSLLQLPWYLFIGAPGAGKTTALLHAGLQFPLAERLGTRPVAGIGGTRQCDWWFTDRAVFLDTAGRYTTQDSQPEADALEWQTFLALLRKHRPVQPINGVIVTVSVPDLLAGGAELARQARSVEQRLGELRGQLGQSFPVYVLVTKADLLAGFVEFFDHLDARDREQAWGLAFAWEASRGGMLPADLGTQLQAWAARTVDRTRDRLHAEASLKRRGAVYRFGAQLQALLPGLEGFVRHALQGCAQVPVQPIRGVHFSSGTQEGNPIDRVLGELSRRYSLTLQPGTRAAATGKAYFLADWVSRGVIAEAALAGTRLQRRRQRRWLFGLAGGGVTLLLLGLCMAWAVSYRANAALIAAVRHQVEQVSQHVRPGSLDRLLQVYALLDQLARPEDGATASPWRQGWGLDQGPRLAQQARQTFQRVLDRTMAPWLVTQVEQALRQEGDAMARYEALRIGMMLSQPARLQRAEVRDWVAWSLTVPGELRRDPAAPAPAAPSAGAGAAPSPKAALGAAEREQWLSHIDALLERNAVLELYRLDPAAVRAARTALVSLPLDQRVYERLLRRARVRAGPDTDVLSALRATAVLRGAGSSIGRIPAVYTRQVWRERLEPDLEPTLLELVAEAEWVLGDRSAGLQSLVRDRAARDAIARLVAQRHARAVAEVWEPVLAATGSEAAPDAGVAGLAPALAAANAPPQQLAQRLRDEFAPTAVSAPATGARSAGISPAQGAYDQLLADRFRALTDYATTQLPAALDELVVPLAAMVPGGDGKRLAEAARRLRGEAAVAPPPWRGLWTTLAASALAAAGPAHTAGPGAGPWTVLQAACDRLVGGRFPLGPESARDLPLEAFVSLFGPQGLLDSFFRQHLAQAVDVSRRPWRLRGTGAVAGAPSAQAQAALPAFEQADDIRRLFFPDGRAQVLLRLTVTPVQLDPGLVSLSADIDGQKFGYENGPVRTGVLAWPGPARSEQVVLRVLPAGAGDGRAVSHAGPWAWLRVLRAYPGPRPADDGTWRVRLEVEGPGLVADVRSLAPPPATLLARLSQFQCPGGP